MISSINALTLAPALCSLLLKPGSGTAKGPLRAFARLVDFSRDGYVWVVEKLVRMMPVALAGAGRLRRRHLPVVSKKRRHGFIPFEDKGAFFINIQLPDGASLIRTEEVADEVTDMLLATDGVTDAITTTRATAFSVVLLPTAR